MVRDTKSPSLLYLSHLNPVLPPKWDGGGLTASGVLQNSGRPGAEGPRTQVKDMTKL